MLGANKSQPWIVTAGFSDRPCSLLDLTRGVTDERPGQLFQHLATLGLFEEG